MVASVEHFSLPCSSLVNLLCVCSKTEEDHIYDGSMSSANAIY